MKLKNLIFLLLVSSIISGCSHIEDRFGNKQNHYKHLQESKTVKLPKTAMHKGNLYDIPKVGKNAKDIEVTDLPPTY